MLEAFFTTVPLVYIFLLVFFIRTKSVLVFFITFFLGTLLDILALRPYGQTSMIYLVIFFLVLLYERKYELIAAPFVFLSSFFGALFLLMLYGYSNPFIQSVLAAIIGVMFFSMMNRMKLNQ
ncbi:MAG: hypothetical protein HYT11_04570 [Candidatus Levybacteria bacterium]|nr:hypothetical protein [Candidatus Levybacteria bacterium]